MTMNCQHQNKHKAPLWYRLIKKLSRSRKTLPAPIRLDLISGGAPHIIIAEAMERKLS